MTSDNLIDHWLDLWEELAERNESPTEAEFIAEHCQQGSPDEIEQFRVQLKRLQAMNAQVANAMPSDSAASVSTNSGDRKSTQRPDRRLRPGAEPIPGYVLQSKLGQGGFGQVWKATAPGGHEVALKFIKLERRVGEAEQRALDVMKNVRHPHLLSYHGSWQIGKALVIAMDLADGTLADRLDQAVADGKSSIPTAELLGYMLEAAKGIDYLNEPQHPGHDGKTVGIQHRDIKPQNILLQGGSVKVADFGLARFVEHSVTGHTGSMTPAYAAPESFNHQTASQSDQYSLAVTYLQMRTGQLPFTGTPMQVMYGHLNAEPDLTGLPEAEGSIVKRALAKKPADRWSSCREFVKKLIAAMQGEPIILKKDVSPESPISDVIPSAVPSRDQQRVLSTALHRKEFVAGVIGVVALMITVVVVQQSQVAVPSPDGLSDARSLNSVAQQTDVENGQHDAIYDETALQPEVTNDKPKSVVSGTDIAKANKSTAPPKPVESVVPPNQGATEQPPSRDDLAKWVSFITKSAMAVNTATRSGISFFGFDLGADVESVEKSAGIANLPQDRWFGAKNTGFYIHNGKLVGIRRVYPGRNDAYLDEIYREFGKVTSDNIHTYQSGQATATWAFYYFSTAVMHLRVWESREAELVQLTVWDREFAESTIQHDLVALGRLAHFANNVCNNVADTPSKWEQLTPFVGTKRVSGELRPSVVTRGDIARGEDSRSVVWLRGKNQKLLGLPSLISDDLLLALLPVKQSEGGGVAIRLFGYRLPNHEFAKPLQWTIRYSNDWSIATCPTLKVELQRCHAALYQSLFSPANDEITIRRLMKDGPDMRFAELHYEWKAENGWTVKVGFDNVVVLHKPQKVGL